MTSISVSQREEMKKEIKEFLISGNYEHEFAILTDNSMSTLKAIDLIQIYQILIKSISAISSKDSNKNTTTRPICPIKGVKEMSKARIVYKIGMINYLEQFGIHLTNRPTIIHQPYSKHLRIISRTIGNQTMNLLQLNEKKSINRKLN